MNKTVSLYKEIFFNLKKLRKELVLTKFEASQSTIIPNPYLYEKIKLISEEIAKAESLFSRSIFVVKTEDYIESCKKLLNEKYSFNSRWEAFDYISTKNGNFVEKVYLMLNSSKSGSSILLLNNASKHDEYINILYSSIIPLTSESKIKENTLKKAPDIYNDLAEIAWKKVEESLTRLNSPKV